ncbi:MAG: hypothetical protein WC916_07710 [Candidatus Woesearchaeota archaeon]
MPMMLTFMKLGKITTRINYRSDIGDKPEDYAIKNKYFIFHNEETLGVKVNYIGGCERYISNYPDEVRIAFNDKGRSRFTAIEKERLEEICHSHNNKLQN